MAAVVVFVDLQAESGHKPLDAHLSDKSYISGDEFTKDDIKVYAAVIGKPGDEFPNAGKWYELVQSSLAARHMKMWLFVWLGGRLSAVDRLGPACCKTPTFFHSARARGLEMTNKKAKPRMALLNFSFRMVGTRLRYEISPGTKICHGFYQLCPMTTLFKFGKWMIVSLMKIRHMS